MKKTVLLSGASTIGVVLMVYLAQAMAQQRLPVRVDRWLQVQQLAGQVNLLQPNGDARSARVGDRLQSVGEGVTTGRASTATLFVDTGIGVIDVAESTSLRIQGLEMAPDNGRITRLIVNQGQARLRVRPFNHRGSRLEIQTPASLSGVRGTVFGVAVQPNGKTGLAVLEGTVVSSALSRHVSVIQGFQNVTLPGEPPMPAIPLRNDTSLKYDFKRVIEHNIRKVQLVGQVDPVNNVFVDGVPQVTDRQGRFISRLQFLPASLVFQVIVITPLGKQQTHIVRFR